MSCLHIRLCTPGASSACEAGTQHQISSAGVTAVVTCHVGAGNRTGVLRADIGVNCWVFSPGPPISSSLRSFTSLGDRGESHTPWCACVPLKTQASFAGATSACHLCSLGQISILLGGQGAELVLVYLSGPQLCVPLPGKSCAVPHFSRASGMKAVLGFSPTCRWPLLLSDLLFAWTA